MEIKNIGEFGLIAHLTGGKKYDRTVILGIGDDAAVFQAPAGSSLLACTDMLVEGVHFFREKTPPAALGHKALAVNLSDIAAMGGIPRQALIAAGWPAGCTLEYAEGVYSGLYALAEEYGVNVIGGDTVSAPVVTLSVTVIGETRGKTISRNGAKPGDLLAVTGRLGAAAAGLSLLCTCVEDADARACQKCGLPAVVKNDLIKAHLLPIPRLREAAILTTAGEPTAMIDLSDGLAGDARQIAAGSGVGILIYGDDLPVDEHTRAAAAVLKEDFLRWALYGGEDYELLVALPPEKAAEVRGKLGVAGVAFTVIGEITPADEGLRILRRGKITPLTEQGFNHFFSSS